MVLNSQTAMLTSDAPPLNATNSFLAPAPQKHCPNCISVRVQAVLGQYHPTHSVRHAVSHPPRRLRRCCLNWGVPQQHVRPIRWCTCSLQHPPGSHSVYGITLLQVYSYFVDQPNTDGKALKLFVCSNFGAQKYVSKTAAALR
jgi:hypothetical protein